MSLKKLLFLSFFINFLQSQVAGAGNPEKDWVLSSDFSQKLQSLLSDMDVEHLSVGELKAYLGSGKKIQLLDSREREEFDVSHLKDAIHIGFEDFDLESTLKRVDSGSPVIVYCSVGYRSGLVTKKLKARGIKAVNLYGGIFEWINQGNQVFDSKGAFTLKIHGYNSSWSQWVTRGEKIY